MAGSGFMILCFQSPRGQRLKMGEAIKTHRKCMVERRQGKRQQYHWKYYPLIEDYMELLKIFQ